MAVAAVAPEPQHELENAVMDEFRFLALLVFVLTGAFVIGKIAQHLRRIADALDRAFPKEPKR